MKIIWDIDRTIAFAFTNEPSLEKIKENYPWVIEFEKRGLLIHANNWHVILPGVIELIKWQDQNDILFDFFSSGIKQRNQLLITTLLILALGQERYSQIAPGLQILSRKDLDDHPSYYTKIKNLRYVTGFKEHGNNILLVDDNKDCIDPLQLRNVLLIEGVDERNFSSMEHSVINSVFFICGMLITIINTADGVNSSLLTALFFLQASSQLSHYKELISLGESELKHMNPELVALDSSRLFSPNYAPALPPLHHENNQRRALDAESDVARNDIKKEESWLRKHELHFFHEMRDLIRVEKICRINLEKCYGNDCQLLERHAFQA